MNLESLLGIKYPIIQGAMANISTAKLAVAVSKAGGLGIVASSGFSPEEYRRQVRLAKEQTDKPFAGSLVLIHPDIEKIIDITIEEGVKIVTMGAGNPVPYFKRLTDAGVMAIPVIANVKMAKKVQELGAKLCIAEGSEAGGHIGGLNTMAMLPQIVDAVDIPVVAAGGIASGRQMLAAEVLGAAGVQVATAFLVAEECEVHDNYKQAVIDADDSDSVVTGYSTGHPVRILKNHMSDKYINLEKSCAPMTELEELTVGSLRAAAIHGDIDFGSVMAGQVSGMIEKRATAAEIIAELMREYEESKKKLK